MFCTPYVRVDLDKVDKNISKMEQRLHAAGIDHWPHIKSHKCVELAKKQLAAGAKGITCAKLSEAEIMAKAGIQHILIGYTLVGEENLKRLGVLAQKVHVRTTVDSGVVAKEISRVGESIGQKIEVLIEIDGGIHRGGVQPGEPALQLAKQIASLPGIKLIGLFAYVGQIYGLPTEDDFRNETSREAQILIDTQKLLQENGFDITVTSGGSTLSSYHADCLTGITESRAGNYIFGDMNDVHVGIYTPNDCALTVCATVISLPVSGYATIDAGTKALTSDTSLTGNGYGYVVGKPEIKIEKLNEEHGFLRYDPTCCQLNIGDRLEIVPNHCCVVPNLCDSIYAYRQGKYVGMLKVDARGKSY